MQVMLKGALLAHLSKHSEMNRQTSTVTHKTGHQPSSRTVSSLLDSDSSKDTSQNKVDSVDSIVEQLFSDLCVELGSDDIALTTDANSDKVTSGCTPSFSCEACRLSFDSVQRYYDHCFLHDSQCSVCRKKFSDADKLQRHVQKHLNFHKCNICGLLFPTVADKNSHIVSSHASNTVCQECDTSFTDDEAYTAHVVKCHDLQPKVPLTKSSTLGKPEHAVYTAAVDRSNREFPGTVDNTSKEQLAKVTDNCEDVKVYSCPQCRAEFKSNIRYNTHLAKVHHMQPYKCNLCGQAIATKTEYIAHLSSHAGENDNLTTDRSTSQDNSIQLFNGPANFKCYMCGKAYSIAWKRQQHLSKVHGIKPYLCQLCGENLDRMHDLLFHLDNHSKENTTMADGTTAPVEISPSLKNPTDSLGSKAGFLEKFVDFSTHKSDEDILTQLSLHAPSLLTLGSDLELQMEVDSDEEIQNIKPTK